MKVAVLSKWHVSDLILEKLELKTCDQNVHEDYKENEYSVTANTKFLPSFVSCQSDSTREGITLDILKAVV